MALFDLKTKSLFLKNQSKVGDGMVFHVTTTGLAEHTLSWEPSAAPFQLRPRLQTAGFQMGHLNL